MAPNISSTATFIGPITYPATKNLRNHFSWIVQQGHTHVTLLISSTGGSLLEGFALYNFFRALPLDITMWNIGSIESIANIVFLAADKRLACPHAYFKFHGFDWTFKEKETVSHKKLKEIVLSLATDEKRYFTLLKEHTSLTDALIHEMDFFKKGVIIEASQAQQLGIVQDVQKIKIPTGQLVFNIDF